jgi:hypothetical protein
MPIRADKGVALISRAVYIPVPSAVHGGTRKEVKRSPKKRECKVGLFPEQWGGGEGRGGGGGFIGCHLNQQWGKGGIYLSAHRTTAGSQAILH